MNRMKLKKERSLRRIGRVRSKITGTNERPRLAVFRSLKHIEAQIIDDATGKTLAACSDRDIKQGTKTERAHEVGKNIAAEAKAKKIEKVVFDRRDKRYHGRVKALAQGAREGGLVF